MTLIPLAKLEIYYVQLFFIYLFSIKTAMKEKNIDFVHFIKGFLFTYIQILTVMNVHFMPRLFKRSLIIYGSLTPMY